MLFQPAPSNSHVMHRQARPRRHKPASVKRPIGLDNDLPALTEDDEVFVALATIDLLQRLEKEPL